MCLLLEEETTKYTKCTKQINIEKQNLITFFHSGFDRHPDGDLALLHLLRWADTGIRDVLDNRSSKCGSVSFLGISARFAQADRQISRKLDVVYGLHATFFDRADRSISPVQRSGIHFAKRQSRGTAGKDQDPAASLHSGKLFGRKEADDGFTRDPAVTRRS